MRLRTLVGICALCPSALGGQAAVPDTSVHVRVGGFVDTYYAYDFQQPRGLDRAYTTQPARHNEFNVNLAFVEAVVSGPRVRGRLALQTGTSVQANYAGEPRIGQFSGPELSRFIQEAVAGYQLSPTVWVDAGIFLSHIGMESFISRDNPVYTRSMIADYSPYYQSGAKVTWQPSERLTAQLDIVNGWQNISETNSGKAVGARLDYQISRDLALSYFNFAGNEAPDTVAPQLRIFHGIGFKTPLVGNLLLQGEADYGRQRRIGGGEAQWYGGALIAMYRFTTTATMNARIERYDDPEQVIVRTGGDPFRVSGASLGFDVSPAPHLVWRSDLRGFRASHALFPSHAASLSRYDGFVVTSLGLTF